MKKYDVEIEGYFHYRTEVGADFEDDAVDKTEDELAVEAPDGFEFRIERSHIWR